MLYLLVILVFLLLALCFWLFRRYQDAQGASLAYTQAETQLTETRSQLQRLEATHAQLQGSLQQAEQALARTETRLVLLEEEKQKLLQEKASITEELKESFRNVASDILRERSEDLDKRARETLSPLREDLRRFGEQVEKTYHEESRERFSLKDSIERLVQRSQEVSTETTNLTRALRGDSKVQGDWGELILERILQQSGLIRGEHYFVQETLRDEQGAIITTEENRGGLRPDVIVRYPNRGAVVIDSKVSLTAYARYVATETEAEQALALREHIASLRKHITELSLKHYEDYAIGSPNFVMLFIPNEPAYTLALSHEPTLWEEAYAKNVVLINGTNLIAALRMAQDMWQRDRQQKSVESIVDEAGKLYDKFVLFAESFLKIESKLQEASEAFSTARGQLSQGRGNILARLEKLDQLGAKHKKFLPKALSPDQEEEEEGLE